MRRGIPALVLAALPLAAGAEVKSAAAGSFLIEQRYSIAAPASRVWESLMHPEDWWPSDHTWSGDRRHLSLSAQAGACFCERWAGGSVEHGRVIMAIPGNLLRMQAVLGPLQEMAISGVITVSLEQQDDGTLLIVTHRASGDATHKLDLLAPIVDQVNAQQFGALAAAAEAES
jgi:uncharacterized protein YndB with AHSA1/START domain